MNSLPLDKLTIFFPYLSDDLLPFAVVFSFASQLLIVSLAFHLYIADSYYKLYFCFGRYFVSVMIPIFIEFQSIRPVSRISSSVSHLSFLAHFSDLDFHRLMFSGFEKCCAP